MLHLFIVMYHRAGCTYVLQEVSSHIWFVPPFSLCHLAGSNNTRIHQPNMVCPLFIVSPGRLQLLLELIRPNVVCSTFLCVT